MNAVSASHDTHLLKIDNKVRHLVRVATLYLENALSTPYPIASICACCFVGTTIIFDHCLYND